MVVTGRWSLWRTISGLTAARKLQGSDDTYSILVGDYRVIYTMGDAVLILPWGEYAIGGRFTAEIGEECGFHRHMLKS